MTVYAMNPRSKTVHIVGPDDRTWCYMPTEQWPRADLALAKVCKVCLAREAEAAVPVDHEREARRAARRAEQQAFLEPWLLADPVYVAACSDNRWGTDVFHAIDLDEDAVNFGDLDLDIDELTERAWRANRAGRLAWTPMCARTRQVWLLEPAIQWGADGLVTEGRYLRPCSTCVEAVHGRAVERAELLAVDPGAAARLRSDRQR